MLLRLYQENKNVIVMFFLSEFVFLYIVSRFFPQVIFQNLTYIVLANIVFIIYVPLVGYFKLRYDIEKEFPFFIAFLYSLSYVSSSRKRFFEIASEAKEFGYISKIIKKILELAIKFRLGFAEAVRRVQKVVPPSNFRSFLDRFSSALEVGEDLSEYLDREFTLALDGYEVTYKRSLENIRTLQEMAVAFMSSLAFGMVVILLLPFLTGMDVLDLLGYFFATFIAANILILLLSKYMIVEDNLLHNLPEKPKEYKSLLILFMVFATISIAILNLLNQVDLPLLPKMAIAITPLAYVSYRTILFEREVKKKEEQFPMFLNTLAGLSEIMATSQVKVIDSLRIHDFKELNKHIENLYRRLVLSYDYFKSWFYFAAETGSKLIAKSILIFARAVELGGDPKKIGEKISQLFSKVLDLRKLKFQFLSHARGMFYGGYIAFAAILYVSIEILKLLQNLFESISTLVGSEIFSTIGLTFFTFTVNIELIREIVDLVVIIQAFVVAMVLRNIDGGSKLAIFLDVAVLLWIAAFLSLGVGQFFVRFFTLGG